MSSIAAILVETSGAVSQVSTARLSKPLAPIDHFKLEDLQKWVGGYVESDAGGSWIANEDGALLGLARNDVASHFAGRGLVGPVVFFVRTATP